MSAEREAMTKTQGPNSPSAYTKGHSESVGATALPVPLERRAYPRQRVQNGAAAVIGDKLWPAPVRDLTVVGIGLFLDQPVEPGTVVAVELPNRVWSCAHLKLLRIIHATPQADNRWLVGSVFLRHVTDDEFQALVG